MRRRYCCWARRGKTHLAVALGRAAILAGYTVSFNPAQALVAQLARAHAENKLEERLTFFSRPKLLIVHEFGYLPFEPNVAHLFFQLVSRRYERGSMLISSNRAAGEWGQVLGDPVVATAILDRLLHHSHVITIGATAIAYAKSDAVAFCRRPLRQRLKPKLPNRGVQFSMTKRVQFRMSFDTAHFS